MVDRWESLGPIRQPFGYEGLSNLEVGDSTDHDGCMETCEDWNGECPNGGECELYESRHDYRVKLFEEEKKFFDQQEEYERENEKSQEEGTWEDSKPVIDKGLDHEKNFQEFLKENNHVEKPCLEFDAEEELIKLLDNNSMLQQPSGWCGGEDGSTSWEDHVIDLLQGHGKRYMSEVRDREAQAEACFKTVAKINKRIHQIRTLQEG